MESRYGDDDDGVPSTSGIAGRPRFRFDQAIAIHPSADRQQNTWLRGNQNGVTLSLTHTRTLRKQQQQTRGMNEHKKEKKKKHENCAFLQSFL